MQQYSEIHPPINSKNAFLKIPEKYQTKSTSFQKGIANKKPIRKRENSLKLIHQPKPEDAQKQEFLRDHTLLYISRIKDPLWKHVCTDFLNMMGPASALKILNCRLGALSPQNKTFDLYCKTEAAAQIAKDYNFVILETLRLYFSAIEELNITTS